MGIISWVKSKVSPNTSTPMTKNPDFRQLWETCEVDQNRIIEIGLICKKILDNKPKYEAVGIQTEVPWYLIAALHYREASLNFRTCLHNGDPLPGPTKHIPRGRGPFKTWEEAAVDALKYDNLHNLKLKDPVACLVASERFNGLGYRRTNELSPYVWAGTNHHDETGKFTSDGVYNPFAAEKQLGIAAIFMGLGLLPKSSPKPHNETSIQES